MERVLEEFLNFNFGSVDCVWCVCVCVCVCVCECVCGVDVVLDKFS